MGRGRVVFLIALIYLLGYSLQNEGDEGEEKTTKAEYYDLVEDVYEGRDHYETLKLNPSASSSDIRKAFRNLSLTYHPDKIKVNFFTKEEQEEALKFFYKLQRAYEVLSSKSLREQYDELRENGIPWKDQHYHRYVHRYWRGAPEHDPFVVLFYFLLFLTVFHYYYVRHRYKKIVNYAKRTTRYKRLKNELKEGGDDEPAVVFSGLQAPKWYEILPLVIVVRTVNFFKSLFQYIYSLVTRKKLTPEELEEQHKRMTCEKYGWSEQEYQQQVERAKRKQQELMNSNKMKRYKRFMKQRGAR